MVNYKSLDTTFGALADATRRGILEQIAQGQSRITDLARPYHVSLPAISKHVRVLEAADLVTRTRQGREHHLHVNPAPIQDARDWMSLYIDVWRRQFDALDAFLKQIHAPKTPVDAKESS